MLKTLHKWFRLFQLSIISRKSHRNSSWKSESTIVLCHVNFVWEYSDHPNVFDNDKCIGVESGLMTSEFQ